MTRVMVKINNDHIFKKNNNKPLLIKCKIMKTINQSLKISFGILLGSMLVSCVSMNKYHTSENRIKTLQTDSARLEASLRKLSAEKLGIETEKAVTEQSLTQQLLIKQDELNTKAKLLNDREKRLRDLERVIGKQNESIQGLRTTIAKALVDFRPEELSVEIRDAKIYVSLQENSCSKLQAPK